MNTNGPLLEVEDLTVTYGTQQGPVTAVSNVSFTIEENEYLGVVGESGCGKSTLARAILGALSSNGTIESGTVTYKGRALHEMTERQLKREIRWKEIAWIPQASMNSLDPLRRVSQQAVELAKIHTDMSKKQAIARLKETFGIVGLSTARIHEYPHQFSGGMNQRAIIALAIFLEPSLIIADEPTTALDVSMQDQILTYLEKLKTGTDTTIMMITHDIGVVFEFCDSVGVMHAAQLAEIGSVHDIYHDAHHPYTILLQRAFPNFQRPDQRLVEIDGDPPQLRGDTDFCSFAERCPWAVDECRSKHPALEQVGTDGSKHAVACVRKDEVQTLAKELDRQRTDTAVEGRGQR